MGEVLSPLQQTMKRHCFFECSPHLAACKAIGAPGQAQCWLHRDFDHPQWRPRTCGACGESWRIWSLHIFIIFSSFSLSESKHTAYSACHPSIYSLTKCLMSWHVLNICANSGRMHFPFWVAASQRTCFIGFPIFCFESDDLIGWSLADNFDNDSS